MLRRLGLRFPPLIGEEEIAEVVDTLRSDWITTGPKVKRFEQEEGNGGQKQEKQVGSAPRGPPGGRTAANGRWPSMRDRRGSEGGRGVPWPARSSGVVRANGAGRAADPEE